MKVAFFDRESIVSEYEKLLEIPEHHSSFRFILAPIGLVGSGKSTVVKPLSKRFSLVRISSDEIREILKGLNYSYKQDDVIYIAVFLLRKYLDKGYGVTFDSNCENKVDIIESLGKEFHVKVMWININPPETFILDKLKNMEYKKGHVFINADHAIATYLKDKPIQRNFGIPFFAEIDTSQLNVDNKINNIGNRIENSLIP